MEHNVLLAVRAFSSLLRKVALLVCVLVAGAAVGQTLQTGDFVFSHIGKAEGLDNQRIFCVCQTPDGAVWWSSKQGVSRYNGSEVRNFSLDEGLPYAHKGARVIKILVDSTHIYAYDNRGYLFEFSPVQGRFLPFGPKKLQREGLSDIFIDGGKMYLAMSDGVFLLHGHTLKPVLRGVYVNKIVKVNDGLLFCSRGGVYDERGRKLLPYNVESAYYDAPTGLLWLGGYDSGLVVGKTLKGTFSLPIRCICPYDESTMLIGIDGQGVYQMSRDGSGQPAPLFDANESQSGVLHGNGVYSMLVDQWKNIVVGTYTGGIDIARPIGSTTAVYKHITNNKQSLLNDHVNAVLSLSDHLLMMGTDNGVSILNTASGTWQHACSGTVALSFCKRPDGKVLVSTYGKGIYEIDARGNARQLYTTAGGQLKDNHVYALCYDRSGNLWAGCLSGSLLQMDAQGRCRYYPVDNVLTIAQLPSGQMAVGTAFGLKLVTPGSGKVEELNYAPEGITDINIFVNHLLIDGQELWIATEGGGVYVWHLQQKKARQLTIADGLPSNHVSSLTKARDGRIWIATEEGLAFVSPTDKSKAVNVDYCYGLDREYARGAVYCLPDNDVLFGSTTGAVVVHPANVQALNYTAKLKILGVSCKTKHPEKFNEEVYDMLAQDKLRLGYSQRTFDLFFESVNMRNHFDINYRYKIDNGEWSQPSDQQYIRFVSMEPGRHRLTLQCISRTCGEVVDEKELTITIAQPWWNSWWMWCVYIALLLLAFYGAWRIYQLQEKYMRLSIEYLKAVENQTPETDESREASPRNGEDDPLLSPPRDASSAALSSAAGSSAAGSVEGEDRGTSGAAKDFVDKATRLIVENLSDSDFSIDRLCREMAMSRTLFYVKLKSYTGKSPQDFIRTIRLERAAGLLRDGRSVSEAAALAGFDNPKYFSTVFKKYFGVSPSKYQ